MSGESDNLENKNQEVNNKKQEDLVRDLFLGGQAQVNFNNFQAKVLNENSDLLVDHLNELYDFLKAMFPDFDKSFGINANGLKAYKDAATRVFGHDNADKEINFLDYDLLQRKPYQSLSIQLRDFANDPNRNNEEKEKITAAADELDRMGNFITDLSDVIYNDGNSVSFNEFLNQRKESIALAKARVAAESQAPAEKKPELSQEAIDQYCDLVHKLKKEMLATNGFFTKDSPEYRALQDELEHQDLYVDHMARNPELVKSAFAKLEGFANAYIQHANNSKPDARRAKRAELCHAIKNIKKFVDNDVQDPRRALEKQFLRTLVYNYDKDLYQDKAKAAELASAVYSDRTSYDKIRKYSIRQLTAPTQSMLDEYKRILDGVKAKKFSDDQVVNVKKENNKINIDNELGGFIKADDGNKDPKKPKEEIKEDQGLNKGGGKITLGGFS